MPVLSTVLNQIGDDLRTMGGDVDGAGYAIRNVAIYDGSGNPLFVYSSGYNYAAQTPGGSLAAAAGQNITMNPLPAGVVVGSKAYLSGGTGTAEVVPVDAIVGNVVTVTCAHTHSGAWTIQSATAGIMEAVSALSGVCRVILPAASLTIRATLILPTTISLAGQLGSTTNGTSGTVLNCTASPMMVVADGNWGVTSQGMAVHRDFTLYGSGSGYGMWIGGDSTLGGSNPSGFANSSWHGGYTSTYNVNVRNVDVALTLRHGNFCSFVNSSFSGHAIGLQVPSDAAGEFQTAEFIGGQIGVYTTGNAVQIDNNGFGSAVVHAVGVQITGTLAGAEVGWDSHGCHYESNTTSVPILNITAVATHRVNITGGTASVHGTGTLASAFIMSCAGANYLHLKDFWFVADSGLTVASLITYGPASGGVLLGTLAIANIDIAQAGVVTNLLAITSASIQAANVSISQPVTNAATSLAASATVTFPQTNYPVTQPFNITGSTVGGSGITAVAGLLPGVSGQLRTINAQTFTSGATIGDTITTTPGLPYSFYYDGTHIFIR